MDTKEEETRYINIECSVMSDNGGNVIKVQLDTRHQDVAETKFENFIGELAEVLGEYFEGTEQEQPNTIYPH